MKSRFLAAGLAIATFAAVTTPASAQVGIIIGRTPPPMRYERRPPPPGEGFVWVDGYWGARDGRYYWVPGRWNRPPYAGGYWSHPHYDRYQDGWHYHEGHWDREDQERHEDRDHHEDGRR
jgi:hypothetical protein